MKPSTQRAFAALALALGAASITICPDDGEPVIACLDCGGPADWVECVHCNGDGLVTCVCEGAGGDIVCRRDCLSVDL